jgi:integrase
MKLALSKRCSCRKPDACAHDWYLRVHSPVGRVRVNVTKRYGLSLPMKRQEVEHHAAKAKHEAKSGLVKAPAKAGALTLGDIADRYMEAFASRSHHYLNGLRGIMVPASNGTVVALGDKPVDEVTTSDVKHAVKTWRARKKTKAGAQGGAVAERHLLQTARHLFNWAIREGYATRTPFLSPQGVTLLSIKTTKGRSRRLEEGEGEKILDVASPFIADFFTAMIETGCRPGELRTLQWSEVRDDDFVVLAEKAKDREERRIPVMPTLRAILDRRRVGPDGNDLAADSYVFGSETGDEFTRRHLCRLWDRTCEAAGIKNLHLHDLRAEAGSQLLEAGVPIHDVRDALGHSSTTMTSTYLRGRVDSLREAFERRRLHLVKMGPRAQREAKGA